MPVKWVEGWYRITFKPPDDYRIMYCKKGSFSELDNYLKTKVMVERVHILSDDELAERIVDGVEAHLKYFETGEFTI